jgi:hypothetical protein
MAIVVERLFIVGDEVVLDFALGTKIEATIYGDEK